MPEHAPDPSRLAQVTVGGPEGDLAGRTGRHIQIAIDAMDRLGGGTVHLAPGTYLLEDSVRLRPRVHLHGSGVDCVLRRGPLIWSRLAIDADKSETGITPVDASGFRPGMGVCCYDTNTGWVYGNRPFTVQAIEAGRLQLDDHLLDDTWAERGGLVAQHFPMILGREAHGAGISDLVIDAAVADPNGILAGSSCHAVYLWRSRQVAMRGLVVRNAVADGICCANSSLDASIEDCEITGSGNYGLHPGSHSAGCTVRRCHIHDNGSDGLYICWGIRGGVFTDNVIVRNGIRAYRSGICIGHKDTDCLIANNRISGNRKHGIAIRRKTAANGAHRAIIRGNLIEDNGSPATELAEVKARIPAEEHLGCGIHVNGITKDLVFEDNIIRETRCGADRHQRRGVCLEAEVTVARFTGNRLSGHPDGDVIDRAVCLPEVSSHG